MTCNTLNEIVARQDLIDAGVDEEFAEAVATLSGRVVPEDVARKTLLDAGVDEKIAEAIVAALDDAGKIEEPRQP